MLHQTKDLQNLSIVATDGAIGDVKDFYFDDEAWAIRYLVVDAGSWLSSRKVLISPIAAGKPDWEHKHLPVSLTREQVKSSPDIDTEMPVTRQHETDYLDYYSYPYYWGGIGLWGRGGYPNMLLPGYAGYGRIGNSTAFPKYLRTFLPSSTVISRQFSRRVRLIYPEIRVCYPENALRLSFSG